MPLINCPECNNEISSYANSCPHCGYPLKNDIEVVNSIVPLNIEWIEQWKNKIRITRIINVIISIINLIVLLVLLIFALKSNDNLYLLLWSLLTVLLSPHIIFTISTFFALNYKIYNIEGYNVLIYDGLLYVSLVIENIIVDSRMGNVFRKTILSGTLPNGKEVKFTY